MNRTHDFQESLALSEAIADESWWEDVYRQAFPFFESMERVTGDTPEQRAGIDRIIHLREGGTIYIDEKVRHTDYDDVLLEIWSSEEHRTWGWACKPLVCDYIAYVFLPSKRCYLFPFQQLQQALKNHWDDWGRTYPSVKAVNRGYTTSSIAVPILTLQQAMTEAGFVQWDKPFTTLRRIL
ncbi:MAG: hypothetical protein FWC43_08285 [Planctomycetaceae bacterium]|nr:hypothetical protein [Planctomycetaceae bacterium]